MAILVEEAFPGRRRDSQSGEIPYLVTGTGADAGTVTDEVAYDAVANATPATYDSIPGSNIDVQQEILVLTKWRVVAQYGGSGGESAVFQQSTVEYEFSFQAPAERVFQSIRTIGCFSEDGEETPPHGGAINVVNDNGEQKVEGIDLPGGSPTSSWVYKPLSASVTDAYQNIVEQIMGDVNSFPFKGRPTYTMRFVSCDGGALFGTGTNPKWAIRFGFQFSRNRSNFTAGGITIPFKGGHHLLWAQYEDGFNNAPADPVNHGPIKRPKFIFVEQVFHESNFSVLGLG